MRMQARIRWRGSLITQELRNVAKQGLGEAAEHFLQVSNEIAPLDEGTLIRSGNTDVEVTSVGAKASVFYDTLYAARLHEHPEYEFQNGRKGKYLEKAINDEKEAVEAYLADRYRDYFS